MAMPKQKCIALVVAVVLIAGAIVALENPFRDSSTGIIGTTEEGNNTVVGTKVGNQAPDFVLQSQRDSGNVRLSDFRGQAVVLNFWATWCPFCVHEMPKFESESKKFDGLEVVGVNLQETDIEKMNRFADDLGVTYTLLLDPDSDVKRAYNVFTQPVTYFINEEGVITDKKLGLLTDREIEQKFAELAA